MNGRKGTSRSWQAPASSGVSEMIIWYRFIPLDAPPLRGHLGYWSARAAIVLGGIALFSFVLMQFECLPTVFTVWKQECLLRNAGGSGKDNPIVPLLVPLVAVIVVAWAACWLWAHRKMQEPRRLAAIGDQAVSSVDQIKRRATAWKVRWPHWKQARLIDRLIGRGQRIIQRFRPSGSGRTARNSESR
jgi:hypothetical protein